MTLRNLHICTQRLVGFLIVLAIALAQSLLSQLVDRAGSTMHEVVGAIRRVTDIVGHISAASASQSAGVGQLGEAIAQMDHSTQQNAALVEQSAAAAESLKDQAARLSAAVGVFRLQAAPA